MQGMPRLMGAARLAHARTARQPMAAAWQLLQRPRQLAQQQGFGSNVLAGKNIFQLRAAAHTVEEASTSGRQEQQPQRIALPTSDESDKLLRIRHSVSGGAAQQGCMPSPGLHGARCAASLHPPPPHTHTTAPRQQPAWHTLPDRRPVRPMGEGGRARGGAAQRADRPRACMRACVGCRLQPAACSLQPCHACRPPPAVRAHHGHGRPAPLQGRPGHHRPLDG